MQFQSNFRSMAIACAVAIASLAAGGRAFADTVAITGSVLDAGQPAAGVKVSFAELDGQVETAISGSDGAFSISPQESRPSVSGLVWAEAGDGRVGPLVETAGGQVIPLVLGEPVEFSGVVADEQKRPLSGMTVTLICAHGGFSRQFVRTAQTGRGGAYRIVVPPLPQGYSIFARGPGFASPRRPDYSLPAHDASRAGLKQTVDLQLTPLTMLAGHIAAPDGSPVANALLTASFDRGTSNSTALSGADGAFAIEVLPNSEGYHLSAQSARFGAAQLEVPGSQAGTPSGPIDIRLPGGIYVSGRVVDPQGNPVPNVLVSAGNLQYTRRLNYLPDQPNFPGFAYPEQFVFNDAGAAVGNGITGADGRFSLAGVRVPFGSDPLQIYVLPPRPFVWRSSSDLHGSIRVPSEPKGTSIWYQAQRIERPATTGEPIDLEIQLVRAETAVFAGSVVDAEGKPVANAEVNVFAGHPEGEWLRLVFPIQTGGHDFYYGADKPPIIVAGDVTGPDGRYRIETVLDTPEGFDGYAGQRPVVSGYSIAAGTDRDHNALSPPVQPAVASKEQRVDLVLSPGAPDFVVGRVVDVDGRPLAGIEFQQMDSEAAIKTDAEGRFHTAALPPDDTPRRAEFGPPPQWPAQLKLADRGWKVLYPQSQNTMTGAPDGPMRFYPEEFGVSGALIVLAKQGTPAANVVLVPPSASRGARANALQPGYQLQTQSAPRLAANATAHLRIVAADDRPLAGYAVAANGLNSKAALSDANGDAFVEIAGGEQTLLRVKKPGEAAASWLVTGRLDGKGVDAGTLKLGGAPSAAGTVLDQGVPQPNREIYLTSDDLGVTAISKTDAEDRFSFDGVPAGPAHLTLQPRREEAVFGGTGPPPIPIQAIVAGGEARDIQFNLPAGNVALHFAGPASARRTFRSVNLGNPFDKRTYSLSDEQTDFRIHNLQPGHYVLELIGEAGRIIDRTGPIEIVEGAPPVEATLTSKTANAWSQLMMP